MKNYKKIILSLLVVVSFGSCKDWMELYPENEQSAGNYWQTKEELEAVLGAGYYNLRECTETFLNWGEIRGNELSLFAVRPADMPLQNIRSLNITPTNEIAKWTKLYVVINMANSVIKYAPLVRERDDSFINSVMNSLLAEAYFQRALAYFYLVRIFKDVPYITEPYVTDAQRYELEKSTSFDILNKLTADLERVAPGAKEIYEEIDPEIMVNTKGRATRWALYSLLADIYLWQGKYEDCERCCNMVINSGKVGLITGDRWFENFYPGNSNESIYEIQYDNVLKQTGPLFEIFNTRLTYIPMPYTTLLLEESTTDIRSALTLNGGVVWKFVGRDATIARLATENDQNWIIYRLADIILMKAECKIMQKNADFDGALNLINMIRNRAFAGELSLGSNESEMLDILLAERHREFVGEGKNWFDMLRIAQRNNYKYQYKLIDLTLISGSSAATESIIRSKLSDSSALYLPIHADELKANAKLVQNPYYDSFGK